MTRKTNTIAALALAALAMAAAVSHAAPVETGQLRDKGPRWPHNQATAPAPTPSPTADAQAQIYCHNGSPPPCPPTATETVVQPGGAQPARKIEPPVLINRPNPN